MEVKIQKTSTSQWSAQQTSEEVPATAKNILSILCLFQFYRTLFADIVVLMENIHLEHVCKNMIGCVPWNSKETLTKVKLAGDIQHLFESGTLRFLASARSHYGALPIRQAMKSKTPKACLWENVGNFSLRLERDFRKTSCLTVLERQSGINPIARIPDA